MEIQNKKITRVKIALQNEKPFFAYLIMNMRFKKDDSIKTIGVDRNGNCYYNEKYIDSLDEDTLKGILAHEVLHIVLEHLSRGEQLKSKLYNISADLCINDMLRTNGFDLDSNGLVPDRNHEFLFEIGDEVITIKDIDKKTSEQIYAELNNQLEETDEATDGLNGQRFDEHKYADKDENGKALDDEEVKNKWKKAVAEASAYARDRGNLPNGLDLFIDELLNEKISWKSLLYKYLTRTIPHDYSYNRPSKRSFSTGVYLPIMRKEAIEIVVSLDTSGSIDKKELQDFMSEINGIAKSFSNLTMKLIVCDYEIKEVYTIGNGDSDAIAKLTIKGGGGTSHKPVYDYINDELPNTKLLINFTDGYTDFDELDNSINTLWVICKDGIDKRHIPFGEVIKL